MSPRTRVGLVGCGLWGRNILRDLLSLGCEVFVADPAAAARRAAADAGAGEAVESLERLPTVDGLVVATPAATHERVVRESLRRDVPVLSEKPFSTDPAAAAELAAEGEGRLFVGYVWRYHPGVEALGEVIRSGELGPLEMLRTVRTNWTSPRTDVDGVWTLAPHDLSIALELIGSLPRPRFARAEWRGTAPVGLLAVLGDRPAVILETSTRYRDKRREVRLHCQGGVAVLSGSGDRLEIARGVEVDAEVEDRPVPTDPALRRELAAFVRFIQGDAPPKSPASEAVTVVRALAELRRMAGI